MMPRKRTLEQVEETDMEAPADDDSALSENDPLCESMGLLAIVADKPANMDPGMSIMGIEIAFQTLKTAAFDVDSLKSLRATCRAFRDSIDTAEFLSSAKFALGSATAGFDALQAWARGGPWMPRTRSLSITGALQPELMHPLMFAITTRKPPISRLELDGVGSNGEGLLRIPLNFLTAGSSTDIEGAYFMVSLARAASHCPALTALNVEIGDRMPLPTVQVFVAAAKAARAWPLLSELDLNCDEDDGKAVSAKLAEWVSISRAAAQE